MGNMGFIEPEPPKRPHYCDMPASAWIYEVGTRWQCDDCGNIYKVESVFDRNIPAIEWVKQESGAA